MSLAIIALSAGIVGQYYENKNEHEQADAAHAAEKAFFRAQIKQFQADAREADKAFSKYLLWQDSITRSQQRQIERIKKR